MNDDHKQRLFQLYLVCLAARKQPDAVNGDETAEKLAWVDAIRTMTYFNWQYNQMQDRVEERMNEIKERSMANA